MAAINKQREEHAKFKAEVTYGYKRLSAMQLQRDIEQAKYESRKKQFDKVITDPKVPTMKDLPGYEEPKRDWSWLWVVITIVGLAALFQLAA